MLKCFSLLLLAVFSWTVVKAQDMTADEILDQYFEVVGGKEKIRAMQSRKMTATMSMQGMEFPGVLYEKAPNMQRIEVDVQGQQIVMAYDGKDAWWIMPFQTGPAPQDMPKDQAESMTKETFEPSFLDYAEKGHSAELVGKEEVEGAEAYAIKLTKKNSDVQIHYFDAEYFVLIMIKTKVDEGPMKGQFVEQYLSDYQEVDGYMMPFYLETKIAGQMGQQIRIKEVHINPELDLAIFSRPKK
jgi:outer membrane lipoprotein-sorting protein